MRKFLWSVIFLLCISLGGYCQSWENLNASGSILMEEGHPSSAMKLYQASLELLPQSDSLHRGVVLHNLASAAYALGSYSDALEYLSQAEKECGYINLNTRASLLQKLGRTDAAEKDFTNALKQAKGSKEGASIQLNLGALQLQCGRPYQASSNAFLALFKTSDPLDSLIAYRLLERAAVLKHDSEEAAGFRQMSTSVLKRRFAEDRYQNLLQATSEAYTMELAGDWSSAMDLYKKALPEWEALFGPDHPETISVAYGIAKSALQAGNEECALEAYIDYLDRKQAFLSSEALRLGQDDLRSFWNTSREGIVDAPLYIPLAVKLNPAALGTLLNAVMLSKGFSSETVRSIRSQVSLSKDHVADSLYAAFLESRSDLTSFDRDASARLERQLTERLSSLGYSSNAALVPSWKESRGKLSPKAVAVEFTDGGAFVYRNKDKNPAFITLPECSYLSAGKAPGQDVLQDLYPFFWGALEQYVSKADTIYFAPSGEEHLIPLEAIPNGEGTPFRNLHKAVVRMVSTADIPRLPRKTAVSEYVLFGDMDYHTPPSGRAVGFFADIPELEGSAIEMDELSRILASRPHKVFRQNDATEEAFRSLKFNPAAPGILHLSTHGVYLTYSQARSMMFYDDNYPDDILKENPMLRNVLMMSGAYDQWLSKHHNPLHDATLTAQEISEMDLRGVSLAVLAACQTALGDSSPEGVLGFPYAFKLAGAGATLASLWEVDDTATWQMMTVFYTKLLDGSSPEEALKLSSEYIRTQERYSNPYYWAPFVIVR